MPYLNKFSQSIFLLLIIGFGNQLFARGTSQSIKVAPKTSAEINTEIAKIESYNIKNEDAIKEIDSKYEGIRKLPVCLKSSFRFCSVADEKKIDEFLKANGLDEDALQSHLKKLGEFEERQKDNSSKLKTMKESLSTSKQTEALGNIQQTQSEVLTNKVNISNALDDIAHIRLNILSLENRIKNVENYLDGSNLKAILKEVINSKEMCQRIQYCINKSTKDSRPFENNTIDEILKRANIKLDSSFSNSTAAAAAK